MTTRERILNYLGACDKWLAIPEITITENGLTPKGCSQNAIGTRLPEYAR